MDRELDAGIAKALGKEVLWIDVLDDHHNGWVDVIKEPAQYAKWEDGNGVVRYMAETDDYNNIYINKVPNYSSSVDVIEELEEELMRVDREFLTLTFLPSGNWSASYFGKKRSYVATERAATQAHARALAIYECLTEKKWATVEEG